MWQNVGLPTTCSAKCAVPEFKIVNVYENKATQLVHLMIHKIIIIIKKNPQDVRLTCSFTGLAGYTVCTYTINQNHLNFLFYFYCSIVVIVHSDFCMQSRQRSSKISVYLCHFEIFMLLSAMTLCSNLFFVSVFNQLISLIS